MTDAELEAQERRILQGAQRAFSPDDRDGERVLARTLAALAAMPPTGAANAPSAEAPVTTSQASLVASIPTAAKLLVVLAFGAGTGLVGYVLGYHNGSNNSHPQSKTAVPASQKSDSTPESDSVSGSDSVSAPDSVSVSASVSASDSVSTTKPYHPKPTPTPTPIPSPLTPDPNALQLELRALRNVERALRDNQPRRALELLGELDRDVPEGALAEERLAAFQMARCALDLGTPSRLSAEFSAQYPNSVYRARVEQTCRNRGSHDAND